MCFMTINVYFILKFKVEPVQLKPTFAGRKRFGQKFSLSFQTFFDCFHSRRGISEALLVRSKYLAKGTNRILLVPLHLVEQIKPSNGHRRIQVPRAPWIKRGAKRVLLLPPSPLLMDTHSTDPDRPICIQSDNQPPLSSFSCYYPCRCHLVPCPCHLWSLSLS